MSATVTSAARALAIGFVLAVAGSAPAWSQSGDGLAASQGCYTVYHQGKGPAHRILRSCDANYYWGNGPGQYYAAPLGGGR